jgi:hypothetical protein
MNTTAPTAAVDPALPPVDEIFDPFPGVTHVDGPSLPPTAPGNKAEEDAALTAGQQEHDARVEGALFPDLDAELEMAGLKMDHMTLTTLTWLRRVNSGFVGGQKPTTEAEIMREVGLFMLAHRADWPVKKRSQMFKAPNEALDDAIEELLHTIPLRQAKLLFKKILDYVVNETATLATPDAPEGGGTGGGNV